MYQVVQAKCPHCKNILRIPADWLDKPMRCKHCHQTFQARMKPGTVPSGSPAVRSPAVSARTPPPPANKSAQVKPAAGGPPPAGNGAPFEFHPPTKTSPVIALPRKRRRSRWWVGPLLCLTVLGLAGGAVLLFGQDILDLVSDDNSSVTEEP